MVSDCLIFKNTERKLKDSCRQGMSFDAIFVSQSFLCAQCRSIPLL
jgi:hypothetical protein